MDNIQILTWVLGAVGITGFILAGNKVWWAWLVNLGCQVLWIAYAILSHQPAFFVTAMFYSAVFGWNSWKWIRERYKGENNLIAHARHELELIGEEKNVIDWYVRVIKEYSSFGHSGGSHMAVMPSLTRLLNYMPLSPITDDPNEWFYHGPEIWGAPGGIWQNKRDGRCFSADGGKTFTMNDDPLDEDGKRPIHFSFANV